jgi:hypothetical protein
MAAKKSSGSHKTKSAGGRAAKARAGAGAIPAEYLKPIQPKTLAAVFEGGMAVAGAALGGAGLAGIAPALAAAAGAAAPVAAPPAVARVLNALGYTTVDEALNVVQVAKREFVRHVGLSAAAIDGFVRAAAPHATKVPAAVRAAITDKPLSFGFILGVAHRSLKGPEPLAILPALKAPPGGPPAGGLIGAPPVGAGEALPASVNMIAQLANPVRNQGQVGTCIPHATLVAFEHFLKAKTGTAYDLSEQFLWWDCKRRDGSPTNATGTFMHCAADALDADGVCQEADWPYDPDAIQANPAQDPPPPGAGAAAAAFRPTNPVIRITATLVADYKRVLASGRCASFAVPVYNSNFNPQGSENAAAVFASGRITLPAPGEDPIGGHCMCMVGYEDDASVPALGGGRFIIRNSYGAVFGATSSYGPGHGTIPYAYIAGLAQDTGIAFL